LLLELLPLHGIMLVDVGTAALAILPLLFVHIPQPKRDDMGIVKPSLWSDVRAGLRYIGDWPGLVALITSAMILKIALTPAFSLLPLLVSQHFKGDAAQLSLLEVVAGVGIILGGLLLSVWGGFKRKIYTTMTGMLILALSMVVLGLTPASVFELALVSVLGVGLMIPLIDGPIMAILQSTVAPEMQGRVFTLMSSLIWITSPFSLAVAGPVSDGLGLQVWYVLAGVLCGLVGLAGFFVPAIVNIEENANSRVAAAESAILVEAQA
jgi:DHA3 family macrolide efflux protein-like MFS transporter